MATSRQGRVDTTTDVLVAIATLETKVDSMGVDIKEIKDGVKVDVEFLKTDKISRSEMVSVQTDLMTRDVDKEERLRFIEKYMWLAVGVVLAIEFLLTYFHPFST